MSHILNIVADVPIVSIGLSYLSSYLPNIVAMNKNIFTYTTG